MTDVAAQLRALADIHAVQQPPRLETASAAEQASQWQHLYWQQACEVGELLISRVNAGELGGAIAAAVWEVRDVAVNAGLSEPYETQLMQFNLFWMVSAIVTHWKRTHCSDTTGRTRTALEAHAEKVAVEPTPTWFRAIPAVTREIAEFIHSRLMVEVGIGEFWWDGRSYRLTRRALRFLTLILSHPGLTTKQLTGLGGQLEGVERGSVERMRARVNSDLEAAGIPFTIGLREGIWSIK